VQPLLRWKSTKYYIFWDCVCSLRYSACKAHTPYYIVICGLSGSTILFHIITYWHQLQKKLLNKCLFWLICNFCLKHFSFQEGLSKIWLKMYIGLHVKYLLFLSCFPETWVFSTDYQISWKSIQGELSSSMWTNRQTDMTKLIVTFCNFGMCLKTALLYYTDLKGGHWTGVLLIWNSSIFKISNFPCSLVDTQHFTGLCCVYLQGLKIEVACSCKAFIPTSIY